MIHFSLTENKRSAVLAIIFLAVAARCVFFSGGIRGSDAYVYAQYAYDIAYNSYHLGNITNHFGFRYTVLLPTAISYSLFGVNDLSSSLFPFLLSILNIFIILKIGEKLYDFKTAFVAGIFTAFYPLDIIHSSFLGPDSFTPILSSLAILNYLTAIDNEQKMNKAAVFFCLSGVMIGIAMAARETSVFIYGVLVLFHILKRRSWPPLLWITLGLVIPAILEMTFYYISEGNAFLRMEILDQLKILIKADYQETAGSLLYYPKIMFCELQGLATYGLIWWFTTASLLFALFKKDYRNLLTGIWVVLPFLGFEFGVQSCKEMVLISKNWNYLALITPPAMLLSAHLFTNFFNSGYFVEKKPLYIIAIFMGLVAINLYGTYRIYLNIQDDAAPYLAVADYLKKNPRKEIYVHHFRWPLFLKYFLRYDSSLQFYDMEKISGNIQDKIKNAYVIMHQRYLDADVRGRRFSKQPDYARYMHDPPDNWKRVISFNGRPTYNNVNLYYAK